MSEKLTKAQRALLERLAVGPKYGSGAVPGALVRKGLAAFFEHGAGVSITPAGRALLSKGGGA